MRRYLLTGDKGVGADKVTKTDKGNIANTNTSKKAEKNKSKAKKARNILAGACLLVILALAIYGAVNMFWPQLLVERKGQTAKQGGELVVEFLDVGQGDAALITCDGHYMMIDGGSRGFSDNIYAILEARGIKQIDIIAASHADADHIGGLSGALNYAKADLVLCPVTDAEGRTFQKFKEYAELNGGGIVIPERGAEYELGGARVKVLGLNEGESDNDSSLIIKVTYGKVSFLFTGDAERAAEEALLDRKEDVRADVLKVSHHGSGTSTSRKFISRVNPKYAVISVGAENEHGHPHESVLNRLADEGVAVYRTDVSGTITVVTDGEEIEIKESR